MRKLSPVTLINSLRDPDGTPYLCIDSLNSSMYYEFGPREQKMFAKVIAPVSDELVASKIVTNTRTRLPMSLATAMVDEAGETCLRIVSDNTSIDFIFTTKEQAMITKALARALGGTL